MSQLYGAQVVGLGKYLPRKVLTNHDLEKMVETSDEWISERTGIRQRHVVSESETVSSMAVAAAKEAMAMAGIGPLDLDLIVMGTFTADHRLPAGACMVQAELGASRAGAFDINSACTGFIYSLLTASQFVKTGACQYVLVIGSDATSSVLDWTDRNTCVLFGDGASALVLKRNPDTSVGVRSQFMCTDGSGLCNLWIPNGGSRWPLTMRNIEEKRHYVNMSGKDVYRFAINALVESARNVLAQEKLTCADIKLMVPHQANARIIHSAASRLELREDQVFVNIDRYGNTVGASVGLALCDAFAAGLIQDGDKLLIVGFGAGLSWGAAIIEWRLQ